MEYSRTLRDLRAVRLLPSHGYRRVHSRCRSESFRNRSVTGSSETSTRNRRIDPKTYRFAFIVATLKRDELVRDGRGQEVDEAIQLARNAQSKILSGSR